MTAITKSDDELVLMADRSGPWYAANSYAATLKDALLRAAEFSGAGGSPYPLQGPGEVVVGHEQMLRLWRRLDIRLVRKPGT
jgi:hypothetical protein